MYVLPHVYPRLAVVDNTTVNIGEHISFQTSVLGFFGYMYSEVELLGHKAVPF